MATRLNRSLAILVMASSLVATGAIAQAAKELGLPENPKWKEVQDGIVILKFPDGTTREHATYNGELIKQGDVNLLAYPMKQITDNKTIKKDLDYYLGLNWTLVEGTDLDFNGNEYHYIEIKKIIQD